MIARLRLAPVSLAALLAGCATTAPTAPPRPTPMPIVELKAEPPPPPARLEITAADVAAHSPLAWRERVGAVYRAREGEPLFLGDGPSLTADGVRAIQLAANAWSHGIPRPADWGDDHVAALQAWIDARDDVVAARRLEEALLLRLMQLEQAQRGRLTQIDADRVPAPLPPLSATVQVTVRATPPGATIAVAGHGSGTSPRRLELPRGARRAGTATLDGYEDRSFSFVADEDRQVVRVTLRPEAQGRVTFRYFPASAKVTIDGKPVPRKGGNIVDMALAAGPHKLVIEAPDGARRPISFRVRAGRTENLETLKVEAATPDP